MTSGGGPNTDIVRLLQLCLLLWLMLVLATSTSSNPRKSRAGKTGKKDETDDHLLEPQMVPLPLHVGKGVR